MNYLTASEIADKWNISSRMVAYYCEKGRIDGAIKKGKTWLVPENANKPLDKRMLKENDMVEIPYMHSEDMKRAVKEGINDIYQTREVLENLSMSRETLRYYEEIGLIQPRRSQFNQYREFDFYDISRLLAIDFYKKRGFSASGIKERLMQKDLGEYIKTFEKQALDIETTIDEMKKILDRVYETKAFCEEAQNQQGVFTIREFPLYQVRQTMDDVLAFEEYKDKVIQFLNLESEDILSNMVRAIAFDEKGYNGSKMCIVKKAENKTQEKGTFLKNGRCAHIILEADNDEESIMEDMFIRSFKWAKEQKVSFYGIVYVFIRFVTLDNDIEHNFYEIWIPIKE